MKDNRLIEMRAFKAVAEAGNFTIASYELGTSQPFISKIIKNLEQRLGVPLLKRSTREQKLTNAGETYLSLCNDILFKLEKEEEMLLSENARPRGKLRISAPLGFGQHNIVPFLPAFSQKYPDIELFFSMSDKTINLIEDNIDIAIRMGHLEDSGLISKKLCQLNRIVVASPGYIKKHGQPQSPEELCNHNCLVWHGALNGLNTWPFMIKGKKQCITVQGNLYSSDGITLSQLCLKGAGILRMAAPLALSAIKEKKLVPLLTKYHYQDNTPIHAVYLPKHQQLFRIDAFISYMTYVLNN